MLNREALYLAEHTPLTYCEAEEVLVAYKGFTGITDADSIAATLQAMEEAHKQTFYGRVEIAKRAWREWLLQLWHDIIDPLW